MHDDNTRVFTPPTPIDGVTGPTDDHVGLLPTDDFEHCRVFVAVRKRLFASGELASIGRYRTRRRLGAGGMGEVYLCDDEELGRQVAVKRVLERGREAEHERLRNEARALARLSHPNVVQVYEVGEYEGGTFIAMEYIEGQTLASWLEHPRDQAEILAVFLDAGRGLAAAHAAGLTHRDFKPENVLIGVDDGVRVVDFGLAFASKPDERLVHEAEQMVAGTIPYMSLEQLQGANVGPRSDQFSFCTALYEALWHQSPFGGATIYERLAELERDQPLRPSRDRALFRVIRRGLALEPARRWPSMNALLTALSRVSRRRLAIRLGSVLAVPLGLALAALTSLESGGISCTGGLESPWTGARRARLESHAANFTAPHTAASVARFEASLDSWSALWLKQRDATCKTLELSQDLLELREGEATFQCLTRLAHRADTLIEQVETGDDTDLAEAVFVATQLPDPQGCAEERAHRGQTPAPIPLRAMVESLRGDLARAHELRLLGQANEALVLARASDQVARELGYSPLIAEARAELAMIQDTRGATEDAAALYDEAIQLAQVEHLDELAAKLLIERVELALHELPEYETVDLRAKQAEAACARAELGPSCHARVAFIRGRLAQRQQDYVAAARSYAEARSLAPADDPLTCVYLDALAGVTGDQGEALGYRRLALEEAATHFGDQHPRTAKYLYSYGAALQDTGRDGAEYLRHAADIWNGRATRWQAKSEEHFAAEALRRRDFESAARHAYEMARVLEALLPPDHPSHGEPEQLLAMVEASQADTLAPERAHEHRNRAIKHARAALRAFSSAPSAGHDPRIVNLHVLIANQLLSLGEFDRAQRVLTRANEAQPTRQERALIALRRAEISTRRGEFELAENELASIAVLGPAVLGDERSNYEVLRGFVELRLHPQQAVAAPRHVMASTSQQLRDAQCQWLLDLGANATELEVLQHAIKR